MKKKRSKSPILPQKCWEIIPRTRVRFDFPSSPPTKKELLFIKSSFFCLSKTWTWYGIPTFSGMASAVRLFFSIFFVFASMQCCALIPFLLTTDFMCSQASDFEALIRRELFGEPKTQTLNKKLSIAKSLSLKKQYFLTIFYFFIYFYGFLC